MISGGGTGKGGGGGGGGGSSDQTVAESWWRPASELSPGISIHDPQDDFLPSGHGLVQTHPPSFGISANTIGKKKKNYGISRMVLNCRGQCPLGTVANSGVRGNELPNFGPN